MSGVRLNSASLLGAALVIALTGSAAGQERTTTIAFAICDLMFDWPSDRYQ